MHPRVVIQGETWRVLAETVEGQNGLPRTDYLIEVTTPEDRDLLGVQRWHQLTGKSAMVEWVTVARHFLDELLKAAGETPNGIHGQRK
jgi:hypothetical protein